MVCFLRRVASTLPVAVLLIAAPAVGQDAAPSQDLARSTNPAPSGAPQPPSTMSRDAEGHTTIRAVRLTEPLRLDGAVDEAVYRANQPFSDYIQMEPRGGEVATEKTEGWILFDANNVYVTIRAFESQPDRMIVNEMRRDSNNIRQGDSIGFSFDTFLDRRNAVQFEANVLGGRTDGQSTNERQYNGDWNPVWRLATGRFEGGWSIEAAIPFKSLRYRPGRTQTWGFQSRRVSKWKNEISYVAKVPPAMGMGRADFSASLYATVTGIEAPEGGRTIEVKPYVIGSTLTDRQARPMRLNEFNRNAGLDAKYSTQNLTADLTVNTDFAQVEVDEQQVNLTRFNLFFPEKREFFLENLGAFTFGGVFGRASAASNNAGSTTASTGGLGGDSGDAPIMFYSRRIGLGPNGVEPILGGGRLSGRIGRTSFGVVNIQTRDSGVPNAANFARATNFSVARLRQDILRRSSLGAIFTGRTVATRGVGQNQLFGVDGTFAFYDNLSLNAYWAKTQTDDLRGDDVSHRLFFDYSGDRYGLQLENLRIGDNFNPEVGFLRRDNIVKRFAQARFSPRPKRNTVVRKYAGVGQFMHVEDGAGRLVTRISDGEFGIDFQNSDRFYVGLNRDYEYLVQRFSIARGVNIPIGGYEFTTGRMGYNFGQQRALSAVIQLERGSFYDGDRTTITGTRGRVNLTSRFSAEPTVSLNWVDLPFGQFLTTVAATRATYTIRPLMFVSALLQYNSNTAAVSGNVRLRWEYRPGSELFVVYNEERDTLTPSFPGVRNRTVVLKINRLFRP
ncbi:MAG: carbohydrate binding family 9 domain-containing protein [Acidimicrobiia bacterium]|nr:carbohydrate binding family 9 domain-containing protein [Acidimicrobiia bacterium]